MGVEDELVALRDLGEVVDPLAADSRSKTASTTASTPIQDSARRGGVYAAGCDLGLGTAVRIRDGRWTTKEGPMECRVQGAGGKTGVGIGR